MTVFTIPPDAPFLRRLAAGIFAGRFGPAPTPEVLPFWTIYLPTRRAVPLLVDALLAESKNPALLLPQIRAIGDVEDEIDDPGIEAPEAVAPLGRDFILMGLIAGWAAANPQSALAQEIAASPGRTLDLAESLGKLADSLDTGETTLDALPQLIDLVWNRTVNPGKGTLVNHQITHFDVVELERSAQHWRNLTDPSSPGSSFTDIKQPMIADDTRSWCSCPDSPSLAGPAT